MTAVAAPASPFPRWEAPPRERSMGWIIVAVAIVQLLDLATTVGALAGGHTELNPFIAAVVERLGVPGLFAIKLALASVIVASISGLRGAWAASAGIGSVALAGAAVASNAAVMM